MKAKLSVLVLNFNGEQHLEDCFQSLRSQTARDFEAVLIDNGSTDDSLALMRRRFPEVRIMPLSDNHGFARAYNMALRDSDSEWCFLLNNDTKLENTCIEHILETARNQPDISVMAPKMVCFSDPTRIDSAGLGYTWWGVSFDRGLGRSSDDPAFAREELVFGGCGGAVVYRQTVLQDIGLFDENFETYAEDVDLAFRAQLAGHRCLYLPGSVVRHKRRATSGVRSGWVVYMTHRNMEFVLAKNVPGDLLRRVVPLHLTYMCLSMLKWALRGFARETFRAKLHAWQARGTLRRKRETIQSARRASSAYIGSLFESPLTRWRSNRQMR